MNSLFYSSTSVKKGSSFLYTDLASDSFHLLGKVDRFKECLLVFVRYSNEPVQTVLRYLLLW